MMVKFCENRSPSTTTSLERMENDQYTSSHDISIPFLNLNLPQPYYLNDFCSLLNIPDWEDFNGYLENNQGTDMNSTRLEPGHTENGQEEMNVDRCEAENIKKRRRSNDDDDFEVQSQNKRILLENDELTASIPFKNSFEKMSYTPTYEDLHECEERAPCVDEFGRYNPTSPHYFDPNAYEMVDKYSPTTPQFVDSNVCEMIDDNEQEKMETSEDFFRRKMQMSRWEYLNWNYLHIPGYSYGLEEDFERNMNICMEEYFSEEMKKRIGYTKEIDDKTFIIYDETIKEESEASNTTDY